MKSKILVLSLLWLPSVASAQTLPQGDIARMEDLFRELPMEAKRLTGPLFWLHGSESKERLESYCPEDGRERQRQLHRREPPAPRLVGRRLVSRPGDLLGSRQAARPGNVDLRREVVAQSDDRRQGAPAVRHQSARGRNGGRGRAAGHRHWKATAVSATWRRWPGAWPTAERSTATA